MEYECPRCHYKTTKKCNLKNHLNRKIHCLPTFSDQTIENILQSLIDEEKAFKCTECSKSFSHSSSLSRHKREHDTIVASLNDASIDITPDTNVHDITFSKAAPALLHNIPQISYIYLIQDGKYRNTNIFKIGRTMQKGNDSRKIQRIQSYSDGTIQYFTWIVNPQYLVEIENRIIFEFRKQFTLFTGFEWFSGDVFKMKACIDTIINSKDCYAFNREDTTNYNSEIEEFAQDISDSHIESNIINDLENLKVENSANLPLDVNDGHKKKLGHVKSMLVYLTDYIKQIT